VCARVDAPASASGMRRAYSGALAYIWPIDSPFAFN
jgi:hypothetical protein